MNKIFIFLLLIPLFFSQFSYGETLLMPNWCSPKTIFCEEIKEKRQNLSESVGLKIISETEITVKSKYIPQEDEYGIDEWNNYYSNDFESKGSFYGDCEDLTLTSLDYAHHHGIPLGNLGLVFYSTSKGGGKEDHVSAAVRTNGKIFTFGDSLRYGVFELGDKYFPITRVLWLGEGNALGAD